MWRSVVHIPVWLLILMVTGASAGSSPVLSVMGNDGSIQVVSPDVLKEKADLLTGTDPNFPGVGPSRFTGVKLADLVSGRGGGMPGGITTISEDQYVVYFPGAVMETHQPFAAWQENGEEIPCRKGGPVKLIYETRPHLPPAANAWYVKTLVIGNMPPMPLTVVAEGMRRKMLPDAVLKLGPVTRNGPFPVPKGYRHGMIVPRKVRLSGVSLSSLTAGRTTGKILFHPIAGRDVVFLAEQLAGKEVFIATHMDGHPLQPRFGGPYTILFPVLRHPELAAELPNPGSLFHVNEIHLL